MYRYCGRKFTFYIILLKILMTILNNCAVLGCSWWSIDAYTSLELDNYGGDDADDDEHSIIL